MLTQYTSIFVLILAVFFVVNAALSIWLLLKVRDVTKKSVAYFTGRDGRNLESTVLAQLKHLKTLDGEVQELYEIFQKIHTLAQFGLSRVGYVRFNPFKDVGGKQSFAIALLDGKKSGIVLSSLYTREGMRVYSKPIVGGNATKEYPLTEEELQAVQSAQAKKSFISEE